MLYLWDDSIARRFEPFALTRPASELRVGAWLLRERWERATDTAAIGILAAPHLSEFAEANAPRVHAGDLPSGAIIANSRCAVASDAVLHVENGVKCWTVDGKVAAVRTTSPCGVEEVAGLFDAADTTSAAELPGRWLNEVWDLVGSLQEILLDDLLTIAMERSETLSRPSDVHIIGEHPVLAAWSARIEPHVVVDARTGPVILLDDSEVHAFTRLTGPLLLGRHSSILGGSIRGSAIGEWCKVHGEMSSSVMLGHANKSHDGFVGHSYLGRWVNLGSGTTTSNLKNTYGTVALWTPDGIRDTGMQFLGTMFGDHAKTGIGLMLTTGCVIGAGANVYGDMPPKVVPPFAWGGRPPYGTYDAQKFVDVCGRVMARRQVVLDDGGRSHLSAIYAARWSSEQR